MKTILITVADDGLTLTVDGQNLDNLVEVLGVLTLAKQQIIECCNETKSINEFTQH